MWRQILPICTLALCALFHGVTGSPYEDPNQRIVGGTTASFRDAPYIAAILIKVYENPYQHYKLQCGGSVITNRHILSAAHCFIDNYEFTARMGSKYYNKGGVLIDIQTITSHPGYSQSDGIDSDIAVLELTGYIPYNNRFGIHTAKLPSLQFDNGQYLTTFGWGKTEDSENSLRLRKVRVPLVDWDVCKGIYDYLTLNMFCAGDLYWGGIDSCEGDSGGPIGEDGTVYGVVSFGEGCGEKQYPGVYTDVVKFLPWIQSHIDI